MVSQESMLRKEQAGKEATKAQNKSKIIDYKIENDDILILSGPYTGQTVRNLFPIGPIERDYIVNKIWFSNDSKVVEIINSLVCR